MSVNLLYCFDENYNDQGYTSINSFLENNGCDIFVYIIHSNPKSFKKFEEKLSIKKNLKKIHVIEFNESNYFFPNLDEAHVSEATYYRLFIDKYLPENVDSILYVDADVLCIKNYEDKFKKLMLHLIESEKIIAVRNNPFEDVREKKLLMQKLNIKHEYFNAGVMFVDLKKWRENKIRVKLLNILESEKENIKFWDQDILNIVFENNYKTLDEGSNFLVGQKTTKKIIEENENIQLIHYAGSFKPWTVRGIFNENSEYYQNYYLKGGKRHYHITHTWRSESLFILLKNILNLKIFKTYKPYKILFSIIRSFINKPK